MDAIVQQALPLLTGQTKLTSTVLTDVVTTVAKNFTAAQKALALEALQKTVEQWKRGTAGATVPYEVEASFELAVVAALGGDSKAAVEDVKLAVTSWWDEFVACGCAKVVAETQAVAAKVEADVDASSLSTAVKKVIDDVVSTYAAKAEAAAEAVVDAAKEAVAVDEKATASATASATVSSDVVAPVATVAPVAPVTPVAPVAPSS